jgi:UDP-N-acetylglucosamine--N-acetylmuramyl-(pentapeptide) pyrophosphoryl-undecaprenol N-acetylglucosamine transferase
VSRVVFSGGGTGGHLYPAIALAEALQAERPDIEVHFVGASRGVEARVLPAKQLPHTLLPFEPIYRDRVWRNLRHIASMTRSVLGLSTLFLRFRPDLVVGTGGYASGPAAFFAVAAGVPVAIQEQNSSPGFTTRMLARWARQIHLGFPEAEKQLKTGRRTQVFAFGNPIKQPDPTLDRAQCRARFGIREDALVLMVVGGSQGSRALNESLLGALEKVRAGALPERPARLEILWATGPTHFESVRERVRELEVDGWVHAFGYIDDMPAALASADVALSRAGAMATAELLAWGIPAILVPLPTSAAGHQMHNARVLEAAGTAVCIAESNATPEALWSQMRAIVASDETRHGMEVAARERALPDAARRIALELARLVPS